MPQITGLNKKYRRRLRPLIVNGLWRSFLVLGLLALGIAAGAQPVTFPPGSTCNVTAEGLVCTSPAPPPPPTFALTLETAGAGTGTVSALPAGPQATGTPMTLTATSTGGSTFAGWEPAPCAPSFPMPATHLTCVATFAPPPPPTFALILTQAGNGGGSISATPTGPQVAGTMMTLTATPVEGSTFAGWSPAPCAASFPMPATDIACMATFTTTAPPPPPPSGGAGTWKKSLTALRPYQPYYYHAFAIDMPGHPDHGKIWTTWYGVSYLLDLATGVSTAIPTTPTMPWRENYGSDFDPAGKLGWIGPQAANPGPLDGAQAFDPVARTYTAVPTVGNSQMVIAADPLRGFVYAFAGWRNFPLHRKPTSPIDAPWVSMNAANPMPAPIADGKNDGARLSSSRGGIDRRTGDLYHVGIGQEVYWYSRTLNRWDVIPTTGVKPPDQTYFALHETSNTLVGWTGCKAVNLWDPELGMNGCQKIGKTWLLDLATKVWREGATGGPCCAPGISNAVLYHRSRDSIVVLKGQNGIEAWEWTPTGGAQPPPPPPPPPTFALSVAVTGAGAVTGMGSYPAGASVTLAATVAAGSTVQWGGPTPCPQSATTPATLTMPANALACTIAVTPGTPVTSQVTVAKAGTGDGTVSGAGSFQAGATVALQAAPAVGSTFAGWSPAPCAPSFVMPPNALACTATFTLTPPPPPPPPPPGQPLPPKTWIERTLPTVTSGSTAPRPPFVAGLGTKDAMTAHVWLDNEWWLVQGYGDSGNAAEGGLFRYRHEDNTWIPFAQRCYPQPPVGHPADQPPPVGTSRDINNHPGERGPLIGDKAGNLHIINSSPNPQFVAGTNPPAPWNGRPCAERVHDGGVPPNGSGAIYRNGWQVRRPAGHWELIQEYMPGSLGGGAYDSATDSLLFFAGGTASAHDLTAIKLSDVSPNMTGPITRRTFTLGAPSPAYANGSGWIPPIQPERSFFAWDDQRRRAYVVGHVRRLASQAVVELQQRIFIFQASTAADGRITGTWSAGPAAPISTWNGYDPLPYHIRVVFDPAANRVLWPVVQNGPCGDIQQMLVYAPGATDPAAGTWEEYPVPKPIKPGVYLRGNSVAFDPRAGALVLAGTNFCATTPGSPSPSQNQFLWLWKY